MSLRMIEMRLRMIEMRLKLIEMRLRRMQMRLRMIEMRLRRMQMRLRRVIMPRMLMSRQIGIVKLAYSISNRFFLNSPHLRGRESLSISGIRP